MVQSATLELSIILFRSKRVNRSGKSSVSDETPSGSVVIISNQKVSKIVKSKHEADMTFACKTFITGERLSKCVNSGVISQLCFSHGLLLFISYKFVKGFLAIFFIT